MSGASVFCHSSGVMPAAMRFEFFDGVESFLGWTRLVLFGSPI